MISGPHLKILLGAAIALWLFLTPDKAEATCAPLSLCSCSANTTDISLGNYDPLSVSNVDGSGSVTVTCTLTVALPGSFDIRLNTGSSGSFTARTLRNGGSSLNYNLYTDSGRTSIWGDGSGGSAIVTQSFSSLLFVQRTNTIYARIPGGQNVPAGTYSDTIIVTVVY